MIWAAIWYCLFVVFTAADVITTKIASDLGLHEANPLMAPFFDHIIEAKLVVLVLAIIVALVEERLIKGHGWVPIALGTTWTFIFVTSNIIQIALILLA